MNFCQFIQSLILIVASVANSKLPAMLFRRWDLFVFDAGAELHRSVIRIDDEV